MPDPRDAPWNEAAKKLIAATTEAIEERGQDPTPTAIAEALESQAEELFPDARVRATVVADAERALRK